MSEEHTPTPWVAEPCACGWSQCFMIMSPVEKVAESVLAQNAGLIAAAPDMLEVLREARLYVEDDPKRAPLPILALAAKMDAAIAKASQVKP